MCAEIQCIFSLYNLDLIPMKNHKHYEIKKYMNCPTCIQRTINILKTHLNLPGIYHLEQNKNSSFIDSEGDQITFSQIPKICYKHSPCVCSTLNQINCSSCSICKHFQLTNHINNYICIYNVLLSYLEETLYIKTNLILYTRCALCSNLWIY